MMKITIATAVPTFCPGVQHLKAEHTAVCITNPLFPLFCGGGADCINVAVLITTSPVLTTTPTISVRTSTGKEVGKYSLPVLAG
jgi:hypothetical protein